MSHETDRSILIIIITVLLVSVLLSNNQQDTYAVSSFATEKELFQITKDMQAKFEHRISLLDKRLASIEDFFLTKQSDLHSAADLVDLSKPKEIDLTEYASFLVKSFYKDNEIRVHISLQVENGTLSFAPEDFTLTCRCSGSLVNHPIKKTYLGNFVTMKSTTLKNNEKVDGWLVFKYFNPRAIDYLLSFHYTDNDGLEKTKEIQVYPQ